MNSIEDLFESPSSVNDLFEPAPSVVELRKASIKATFERMANRSAHVNEMQRQQQLRGKKGAKSKEANFRLHTKTHFQNLGYVVINVSTWDPVLKRAHDLYGLFDMTLHKRGEPVIYVQFTSAANMSARLTKVREGKMTPLLLSAGCRILVVGWKQETTAGGAVRWTCKETEVGP